MFQDNTDTAVHLWRHLTTFLPCRRHSSRNICLKSFVFFLPHCLQMLFCGIYKQVFPYLSIVDAGTFDVELTGNVGHFHLLCSARVNSMFCFKCYVLNARFYQRHLRNVEQIVPWNGWRKVRWLFGKLVALKEKICVLPQCKYRNIFFGTSKPHNRLPEKMTFSGKETECRFLNKMLKTWTMHL